MRFYTHKGLQVRTGAHLEGVGISPVSFFSRQRNFLVRKFDHLNIALFFFLLAPGF